VEKRHALSQDETVIRCPGEAGCSDWIAAAEPKIDVCKLCVRCEGRGPLSVDDSTLEKEDAEYIADRIERLVQERRAGRRLSPAKLESDEWELLLIWDEAESQLQRLHEARIKALFEAVMSRSM
jgi:hypothetical protein